jgi:hypothetical protein
VIARQRRALHDLAELVSERATLEPGIDRDFEARNAAADEEFDTRFQEVVVQFASQKEVVERELQAARQRISGWYSTERAAAIQEYTTARQQILRYYSTSKAAAKSEFQEARWTITAVLEGSKSGTDKYLHQIELEVADAIERMKAIDRETRHYLRECRQSPDRIAEAGTPPRRAKDPLHRIQEYVQFADWQLVELKALKVPPYLKGERLLWVFGGLLLLSLYPAALLGGWVWGPVSAAAIALVLWGVATVWLRAVAQAQVNRVCGPLFKALRGAESLLEGCRNEARLKHRRQVAESKRRYAKEVRQVNERFRRLRAEYKQRRVLEMKQVTDRLRQKRSALKERRSREWKTASEHFQRTRAQIQREYETDSRGAQDEYERRLAQSKAIQEDEWNVLVTRWSEGLTYFQAEAAAINEETGQLLPDWGAAAWTSWTPPTDVPPALRFGTYQVKLASLPGGLPQHERLQTDFPMAYTLPALLGFPDQASVLLTANDEGRPAAVQALQTVMYRMLTTIPAGKVRFTIIDPVGLGQNFASFMHLADADEALVTSRIWTEAARIEQRLADFTEHMEDVIQKYLRNQFESIEEYNAHAGEVAEPYRVLVVANFPVNFTSEAVRRLISIINSGPRCGVYTLLSVDTRQPLPQGTHLEDLEQVGIRLAWDEDRFAWCDADFGQFPLSLDGPPAEELGTKLLLRVGERAKETKRVEVPFEFVAPAPEQWWTGDTRPGIHVPLGRVGATKRQYLHLGQGTSQHVLIAGKTGSGKSTLLHALICNLSLLYSPDEVELYLVDFKKGVEFKTYANHELPHARVVAVESEREFGLSVLQRLDQELKIRGERFRAVGAQDLAGYRQANGSAPLPRILLIVDEFQEFFVEDDKVAQEAALLLDRLVRQGRAFGLHVLLGSQTLGGAYSLARSTIDQMAVRIALQCSEVDGHLILSEDNSAARLLSRPGEAIYNDANGLVEGNNPFQVVWLADERREDYLNRIQELNRQQRSGRSAGQIVFEGNTPSDIARNPLLQQLLERPTWPTRPKAAQAWLGEPVAIKDPTTALFRRQTGSNLLIVGQYEESALSISAAALVSLAGQYAPDSTGGQPGPRFYVLDGTPDDMPQAGYLSRLASCLPHGIRAAGWREAPALVAELAEELDRRQKANDLAAPDRYLFVHGLQRFRDLRRPEDDYGFGRTDAPPTPAAQFATLLQEGPSFGIHTLVWCDSLNNLHRALERSSLREFELRVLFQMSTNDSSTLIDSPAASRLGLFRALFHSEDQGRLEKFRPYGLPPDAWLEWVTQQFARKQSAE